MQVLKAGMFETVVDGATRVFAQVSYRRAMMSDIAAEAGVSLATLYRYADTKEALFELALRRGFGMPTEVLWTASRSRAGFQTRVERYAAERFAEIGLPALLSRAVASAPPTDVAVEFAAIVGELFDGIDRLKYGIRILDRSTADWPALAQVFVARVRGPVVTLLERYLTLRSQQRRIPTPPDIPAAARLVLEICSILAMHRHFTSGGSYVSDPLARATAIHAATNGFTSSRRIGAPPRRPRRKRL